MLLACPKCHEKLELDNNTLKCINNHSYDYSKTHYINLLLNNDKNSLNPGDNKECLTARKEFLNNGYYESILNNVISLIMKYSKDDIKLLDLGCGEGYYTNGIHTSFKNIETYGIDISKDGINMATKYNKDINWIVANNKNIPLLDNSINITTALFTVINLDEIKRISNKDAILIHVTANSNHLIELKNLIYNDVILKEDDHMKLNLDELESINIKEKITIDNNYDLINLLKMTPHYYRMKKDKLDYINTINNYDLSIDVKITVYKI